jgi:hypothetical protein
MYVYVYMQAGLKWTTEPIFWRAEERAECFKAGGLFMLDTGIKSIKRIISVLSYNEERSISLEHITYGDFIRILGFK